MNTERTLYEIEVALAKSEQFNYVKNIVAFNVNGIGSNLLICHECDMLVLSKSGYLTEIEIKRSWADFIADFSKKHSHENMGIIRYFYYCVPEYIVDKVYEKLKSIDAKYSGVITYDENLKINVKGALIDDYHVVRQINPNRKLFLEEQLQVARYGAMRSVLLKEKLIKSV